MAIKKKPRTAATGGASEIVRLGSVDGYEDTASHLARQARRLAARFGLSPEMATAIAELAFYPTIGGAR
jgi:hypothetical protein